MTHVKGRGKGWGWRRDWLGALLLLGACDRAGGGSSSPDSAAQLAQPAAQVQASAPWFAGPFAAEDGYRLWLRYPKVGDPGLLAEYQAALGSLVVGSGSPTLAIAAQELERGLAGLLGAAPARPPSRRGATSSGTRRRPRGPSSTRS